MSLPYLEKDDASSGDSDDDWETYNSGESIERISNEDLNTHLELNSFDESVERTSNEDLNMYFLFNDSEESLFNEEDLDMHSAHNVSDDVYMYDMLHDNDLFCTVLFNICSNCPLLTAYLCSDCNDNMTRHHTLCHTIRNCAVRHDVICSDCKEIILRHILICTNCQRFMNHIRDHYSDEDPYDEDPYDEDPYEFDEESIQKNPVPNIVFKTLPIIEIDERIFIQGNQCVICLEKFDLYEKVINLPCFHNFHIDCIKSWFDVNNFCPTCKRKIPSSETSQNSVETSDESSFEI